ncbi:MAG: hypothetical protein ACR2P4_09550 [Gammaproteobacteria bacterium]
MKKMFVIVAFSLAAAFAPAASAQEEPKLTETERAGVLIGYAELCQEFGLRLLDDHRVNALKEYLGNNAGFRKQRERILRRFRGVDTITDIDRFCPKVDKWLDEWAKVYGIPTKKGE